jgi:hypothetical protein
MLPTAAVPERRPRGDLRIFDQLHEMRSGSQMRPRPLDVIGERRGAEREDDVVGREQIDDPLSHRRQETGEERMILGEAAAPGHRRHPDGGVVPLGEVDDVVPGLVAIDRRAHDERRTPRRVERVADRLQHARLGSQLAAHDARRDGLAAPRPVVGGYRNQHRTRAAVAPRCSTRVRWRGARLPHARARSST